MKENSRIRFNPGTKEIEIEGSERFVKAYFNKLQAMMTGTPEKTVAAKKESKVVKAAPTKMAETKVKAAKAGPARKAKKEPNTTKPSSEKKAIKVTKKPGEKRITHIDMIVELIQDSAEGISTADLKEKSGLSEHQIWSIVNRAAKLGKIKKMKRGLYGAVAAS